MKVRTGYEEKRIQMELVALMDLMFLLLIFFIYAVLSMGVKSALEVLLPSAEGTAQKESMVITIDRDNQLIFANKVMGLEQVVAAVSKLYAQRGLPVVIQGHRQAELGTAVELLAGLRLQGIEAVSFQVQKGSSTE
jgi:biopolymer transport protein ExbD